MKRLLSTKLVPFPFKEKLLRQGFSVVEMPFIKIIPLENEFTTVENHVIFTSQNAVRLVFEESKGAGMLKGKKTYCVGKKTEALLRENGQKVTKTAQNASELATFLIKKDEKASFSFFCAKARLPHLENRLKDAGISITAHEMYETVPTPTPVKMMYDGILFFSPSGVNSFFSVNQLLPQAHCFCIGNTTAEAVAMHTDNYSVAKKPEEPYLLISLRNYFTAHD